MAPRTLTTIEFVERARLLHGDKYSYDKTVYTAAREKVLITCPKHGDFEQRANSHMHRGAGCYSCGVKLDSLDDFIDKANDVHKGKYGYSLVSYINSSTKIKITCPIHGLFEQVPKSHLKGIGCKYCGYKTSGSPRTTLESFISRASKLHCNKYDYSQVEYVNNKTKVAIICRRHGSFYQKPNCHLSGQGCSKCKSSVGETLIRSALVDLGIPFEEQTKFSNCLSYTGALLRFDFYIPQLNTLIEYDGIQHFEPVSFGSGTCAQAKFAKTIAADKVKDKYAMDHNIKLLRIPYSEKNRIPEIIAGLT